jgi:uncharacterized protein YqeY
MGELNDAITEELKAAMRSKDSLTLAVLRGLKAAIKNAAIEKGGADAELTDTEALAVVRKQVKQRQDSVAAFASAGRADLEEKENQEIAVLEKFLPAELSEAELEQLVKEVIASTGATSRKEMGQVMGMLQQKVAGRADNRTLSQMVQTQLG